MKTRKRLAGSRVTRKQLKRDPFVDRVFDWALWSRENTRRLLVGTGVVALVLLAALLYRQSRAAETREAAERYQEIWGAYTAGNYQLAANDFRQFRNQYAGTEYADEAALYLADSYFQVGDFPAAIRILRGFEDEHGDSPLRYAAAMLLGASYEASGDWTQAAAAFEEGREEARFDYQRADARMSEARALAAGGETEAAAAAYRAVVEEHPDSPRAGEARVRLAELTVEPLRSEETPPGAAAGTPAPEETEAAAEPATESLVEPPSEEAASP